MLQHVFERASLARYIASTIVATDDERVYEAARRFGAPVRMTRSDHISGTDRVAEVASAHNCDIVVNIQADEPLIDPEAIDAAILPVVHDFALPMSTLKKPGPRSQLRWPASPGNGSRNEAASVARLEKTFTAP